VDASDHVTAASTDLEPRPDQSRPHGWLWKLHRRFSRQGAGMHSDAAAAVYGLVVASAVLAVDSGNSVPTWQTTESVIGALLIYWLAETYAHVVTSQDRDTNRAWLGMAARHLREELPLVTTPLWLLAVLGIARLAGASRNAAVTWALVASVALLGWAGGHGAYRAGRRGVAVVVSAALGAAFGAAAILLKAIVHSPH
jgi:hypothetical protein